MSEDREATPQSITATGAGAEVGQRGAATESSGVDALLQIMLRREEQMERERLQMTERLERLMSVVEQSHPIGTLDAEPSRGRVATETIRLTRLTETDDIEAYLTTFERIMQAYEVDRATWAFKLAPQLTGRAQQAYAAMPGADAGDYGKVRETILRRYDISEETYRQRFRAAKKESGESYRELVARLQDLEQKWTRECTDVEQLRELVVREQLLNTLPTDIRVWVAERKPRTAQMAAELADDYVQARKQTQDGKKSPTVSDGRAPEPKICSNCGLRGHLDKDCRRPPRTSPKQGPFSSRRPNRNYPGTGAMSGTPPWRAGSNVRCYNCSQVGHIASQCPHNAHQSGFYSCGGLTRRHVQNRPGPMNVRPGVIEGRAVMDIVLDTGCSRTLVHRKLVPPQKMLPGSAVTIRCAHGDTVLYPLAAVDVEIRGKKFAVEAAVSDTLPASVLLGTDVPELTSFLGMRPIQQAKPDAEALVVMTRKQRKKQNEDEERQNRQQRADGADPKPILPTSETEQELDDMDLDCTLFGSEFDDEIFCQTRERERKTRREKRLCRFQHSKDKACKNALSPLDMDINQFRELQEADPSLRKSFAAAAGEMNSAGAGFIMKDGLLYRQWTLRNRAADMTTDQLVVPAQCRAQIIRIAHSIPLAGHMGRDKTTNRILHRFYWPTLYKDVAEFCRSCQECQKARGQKMRRAPLIPLPIVGEAFRRIAMDIVGPLPRSRAGNRYVLVVCDYATRYPEAVPLRSIEAERIAEELIQIFSRVGIPREILTDQGSNFMSRLLAEVYRMLQIQGLRTSPYHPQTDGLVERFNQTLKTLLRKSATTDGKDWDKLLPYLLFAYREVPQASTGFSPFELVYGRPVRGPLDVVKENWEAEKKSTESVVSYVLSMREKITQMMEIVHENLSQSQAEQKRWYDRTAREREFQPNEEVLVLLPTSTNKLLAQWKGPYKIVRRAGPVNYLVDMHDTRKRKRIFHVNMLRKWNQPPTPSFWAEEAQEEHTDSEEMPLWSNCPEKIKAEPNIGAQLTKAQGTQLTALLQGFCTSLQDKPGRTTVTMHHIPVKSNSPVRLPPYRLPHAYREAVQKEIAAMLEEGIIKRSTSEWAAPIVLVPKKDGTLRFCVDYRRLNTLTRVDAYPMPRIDDLIDQLSKAKYITTLDLARGYWQVPVAKEDQCKTAFTTPFGLYEFNVMPFGLCGAPATFQRMMDTVLHGLEQFSAAYLDDIVIYSNTWNEHLQHIQAVFKRLRHAGLTAKPAKCQFGMAQCSYLGHVVGNGRVCPEDAKVTAVKEFPKPKTKRQVRAFLGLTGYYRRFIKDFASTATPLTDLTRKSAPSQLKWTEECEQAFHKLRDALCKEPVLRGPDFNRQFVLQTDASNRGVGAVLSQRDDDGTDRPVAYYSKKLLPREEKYSTIEKECLAIKLAVQAFRVYLLGRCFLVQTDHRALQWLDQLKENNARLTRWSLYLQSFKFSVEHRSGKENGNADALSRQG